MFARLSCVSQRAYRSPWLDGPTDRQNSIRSQTHGRNPTPAEPIRGGPGRVIALALSVIIRSGGGGGVVGVGGGLGGGRGRAEGAGAASEGCALYGRWRKVDESRNRKGELGMKNRRR